jgi:putative tricarboxylic transport membrane protein
MKLNDAVFGLLLLALGVTVLVSVQAFPNIPGQKVGPGLFPGLIATGLCVGGLLLLAQGLRERASVPWIALQSWVRSPRHLLSFALLVASVLFYMLVSEKLGFVPTAIVVLTALFHVLRVPLAKSVLFAVLATLLIHFAFYKMLRVPLPWGVLADFAW